MKSVNLGKSRAGSAAKGAVTAAVRLAGDKVAAAAMRLRGAIQEHIPPEQLVQEWRVLAAMDELPPERQLAALCASTLAGWSSLQLADHILLFDAWGFMQQKQPAGGPCLVPRPLLRAMEGALWGEHGAPTVFDLNLCAVRTGPFMDTPAADLARSILDAVIHACAKRVRTDFMLGATMGPLFSMAPQASRTRAVQAELHLLRTAAAEAVDPLEQAIHQRIAWTKHAFTCASFTARSRVAASLARDSVQAHGGNLRATFVKAFGCAPDPESAGAAQTPPSREAAEGVLQQLRHRETGNLMAAAAAEIEAEAAAQTLGGDAGSGGTGGKAVEKSALSVTTVHSDGRTEGAQSP